MNHLPNTTPIPASFRKGVVVVSPVKRADNRESMLHTNLRVLIPIAKSAVRTMPASQRQKNVDEWVNFFLQETDLSALRKRDGTPMNFDKNDVYRRAPVGGMVRKFVISPQFKEVLSETISKK